MKYTLRPYQEQAVNKMVWSFNQTHFEGGDLIVLPTGAGKSVVIAEFVHRINQPVLILQPSREILQQNYEKLCNYIEPINIGIYSASMNRKDLGFITFATIQSIYKKPELFAHFKTVIIDECHLVNPQKLDGMFTQFLKKIGNPRVFGLTATPYRMSQTYERLPSGTILTHTTTKLINRLKERFWHRVLFNINNEDLLKSKYLCPMKYIDKSFYKHSDIPTNASKSDFDLEAFEEMISDDILITVFFGLELARKSVLVFCTSIEQASFLCDLVPNSAVVTSKTSKKERARIIKDFKNGDIKVVFNVQVLTIGFDHPELDCIILLRPTRSIGLYYQMLGRGVRLAEGKEYCTVIDITGTVKELGRIETIKLVKRDNWELESECGSWHKKPLYSFLIR